MTEEIKIRNLTISDYVIVHKGYQTLHSQHVEGRPDIYKEMGNLLPKEEYQEMLEDSAHIMIGAEEKGGLTGFLIAKRKVTPADPMLHRNRTFFVDALYVEQDSRRRGIARRLYEYWHLRPKRKDAPGSI